MIELTKWSIFFKNYFLISYWLIQGQLNQSRALQCTFFSQIILQLLAFTIIFWLILRFGMWTYQISAYQKTTNDKGFFWEIVAIRPFPKKQPKVKHINQFQEDPKKLLKILWVFKVIHFFLNNLFTFKVLVNN